MKLPRWVNEQLANPHGLIAPVMALLLNRGNRVLNLHMVAALDLQPGQRVLEIGFGGGYALKIMQNHEPRAQLEGVELSAAMLRRARRALGERVALHEGSIDALPFGMDIFDGACTANTVYFWPDIPRGLSELHRVLKPRGRAVIAINPPDRLRQQGFDQNGYAIVEPDQLCAHMITAGLVEVQTRRMPDPTEGTIILEARKAH